MAVFDFALQRMCVRVVYDGTAGTGKTTNLQQLAELFATQTRGELFSPAEMGGRTLYFDWLQIAAGMVCGLPLLCQVITVPGQVVLSPRRRHLLFTADVVVHVCDSEPQTLARSLDSLTPFDEMERERGEAVPLVIQANKQDRGGALTGAALLTALGRRGVPVVEAIASDGIGVIDTFVTAVRCAVRKLQARVDAGDVKIDVRPAETADAALAKLSVETVDPEWAIEMMLEEASNAFALSGGFDTPMASDPATDARETPEPTTARPPLSPTFPHEHVPTGYVWPAHTGRAALRSISSEAETKKPVTLDAQGNARVLVGDFVLWTSRALRFDAAESARQALIRAARERTQLGALLAPDTVIVVQPSGAGDASWLWSLLPRMPTVADLLSSSTAGNPPRSVLLAAFGSALAEALRVEAEHGLALDLLPSSFGVRHGVVRYVVPVTLQEPTAMDLGRRLMSSARAISVLAEEAGAAVEAFEASLAAKLGDDERKKLASSATWSEAAALPAHVREISLRFERALYRRSKAA